MAKDYVVTKAEAVFKGRNRGVMIDYKKLGAEHTLNPTIPFNKNLIRGIVIKEDYFRNAIYTIPMKSGDLIINANPTSGVFQAVPSPKAVV